MRWVWDNVIVSFMRLVWDNTLSVLEYVLFHWQEILAVIVIYVVIAILVALWLGPKISDHHS